MLLRASGTELVVVLAGGGVVSPPQIHPNVSPSPAQIVELPGARDAKLLTPVFIPVVQSIDI